MTLPPELEKRAENYGDSIAKPILRSMVSLSRGAFSNYLKEAYLAAIEAYRKHLLSDVPEFDDNDVKKYISDVVIGVPESEFDKVNSEDADLIREGARWQHAQIAERIAAMKEEIERVERFSREEGARLFDANREIEILKSRASQFESTIKATMQERDQANAKIKELEGK